VPILLQVDRHNLTVHLPLGHLRHITPSLAGHGAEALARAWDTARPGSRPLAGCENAR
jgi:hypothetical protein